MGSSGERVKPGRVSQRFYAHMKTEDRHHAHLVPTATSLMEAAIVFAEHWSPATVVGEAREFVVIARDGHTGEEQCFTIDLASGDAEPCT